MKTGNRAVKLLEKIHKDRGVSLILHLDRFIGTIESLADECKVKIVTNLDKVRKDIISANEKKPNDTKLLVGREIEKALKEALDNTGKVKQFHVRYKVALKGFIGILNSLQQDDKIGCSLKLIIKPFLKIEAE